MLPQKFYVYLNDIDFTLLINGFKKKFTLPEIKQIQPNDVLVFQIQSVKSYKEKRFATGVKSVKTICQFSTQVQKIVNHKDLNIYDSKCDYEINYNAFESAINIVNFQSFNKSE